MLYAILVVLLVAADQLVKILVRANIPMGASMPFLPGLVELTYVQNTGAAFSIFKDHTWLLTIISAVVAAAIAAAPPLCLAIRAALRRAHPRLE